MVHAPQPDRPIDPALARASALLRLCAGFDFREPDDFEAGALRALILRYPHLDQYDWEQAVIQHYDHPDARRARPGDLAHQARHIHARRTGTNRPPRLETVREPMPEPVRAQIERVRRGEK